MRVIIEADGGSRGNPGPAGYGAVVFDADTRAVLAERKAAIGVETNNVAEYGGLIAGLEAAAALGASDVHVRMDSKLVVEQMSGRWQVKHPSMKPLARRASELRRQFDEVRFEWIPRAHNAHADRLANEAMDEAAGGRAPAARPPAPTWAPPSGTPTRLILLRHGLTEHSVARLFSGRNELPLTAEGRAQALGLARRAPSFGDVAAVIASPLRRTLETASMVADALSLPVKTDDGLMEVDFGEWEGLSFADIQKRWPTELTAWLNSAAVAPPKGESFDEVTIRVRRARTAILAAHPGRTVVVVSHVTPIKTLLRLALDGGPAMMYRLHLDTASMSTVDIYADGNSSVRLVNDTSHLERVHQVRDAR